MESIIKHPDFIAEKDARFLQHHEPGKPECFDFGGEAAQAILQPKIDALLELLRQLSDEAKEKYESEYRSVSAHNNTDGVGIHFGYWSYPSIPKVCDMYIRALKMAENTTQTLEL